MTVDKKRKQARRLTEVVVTVAVAVTVAVGGQNVVLVIRGSEVGTSRSRSRRIRSRSRYIQYVCMYVHIVIYTVYCIDYVCYMCVLYHLNRDTDTDT